MRVWRLTFDLWRRVRCDMKKRVFCWWYPLWRGADHVVRFVTFQVTWKTKLTNETRMITNKGVPVYLWMTKGRYFCTKKRCLYQLANHYSWIIHGKLASFCCPSPSPRLPLPSPVCLSVGSPVAIIQVQRVTGTLRFRFRFPFPVLPVRKWTPESTGLGLDPLGC